jgi:hypothetical protein
MMSKKCVPEVQFLTKISDFKTIEAYGTYQTNLKPFWLSHFVFNEAFSLNYRAVKYENEGFVDLHRESSLAATGLCDQVFEIEQLRNAGSNTPDFEKRLGSAFLYLHQEQQLRSDVFGRLLAFRHDFYVAHDASSKLLEHSELTMKHMAEIWRLEAPYLGIPTEEEPSCALK